MDKLLYASSASCSGINDALLHVLRPGHTHLSTYTSTRRSHNLHFKLRPFKMVNLTKGVRAYCWIGIQGYTVTFAVHQTTVVSKSYRSWYTDLLEVDSKYLKGYTGKFTWTVSDSNGNVIASKFNEISTWSGDLEGGNMTTLSDMVSITSPEAVITFGFYDAGSGQFGLPNTDECWVTVTPRWSNWMATLAPLGSSQAAKPFTTFVLPSAHDVGMNTMSNCMAIVKNASSVVDICVKILETFGPVGVAIASNPEILGLLATNSEDILSSLSITQKDPLIQMLETGARYFEFRPAHLSSIISGSSPIPNKLYFTHMVVPGMAFDDFLNEAVEFLVNNATEIVVVQIRFDGIDSTCAKATDDEVNQYVHNALLNQPLVQGTYTDMSTLTIDQLRAQKKRLIILTHADQYSTYSDGPYATLTPGSILATYPPFITDATTDESGKELAIFQCQATATNIKEVAVYSAVAANGATSSLLCTKSVCDIATLPWLDANVFPHMPATTLQAVMNDWFDGATADVAVDLSRKYLSQ